MSGPDCSALLSPLRLPRLELRNRIMMTAHVTNMAQGHLPSEQHVAYYAERARGGIALIVMGFPSVHPTSLNAVAEVLGYDPAIVPGMRRIADAVHQHGAKIIAQLGHAGRQSTGSYSMRELWAPSAIPCPFNREMPKAMEGEDLDEVVDAHARTARNIVDGGFDGVELHSGYGGYLLSSFLSPYMNDRDDEYGGSLENRLRLPLRVLEAVRLQVGPDVALGMQINGHDYSPGGIDVATAQQIAERLVGAGCLDYVTVKGSTYYSADQNIPDMQHPRALWAPLAAAIKERLGDFPVFAVGRITDPGTANELIRDGKADMVAMTRQHIADPETANKIAEGRFDDLRGCIACNQGCLDMVFKGRHVTCIHNPAAGYEETLGHGTLAEAETARRIVVVGGGPAGMKTAEIAARRGHDVTLLERRNRLGGQVELAKAVGGREEFGEVTRYLTTQIGKLGVDVHLGVQATADHVLALEPDAVVVATGSEPVRELIGLRSYGIDAVPGLDRDEVLDVWQLLEEVREPGQSVLVVDDGEGYWKGISVAVSLARAGHRVRVATPLPYVGAGLGPFSQGKLIPQLFELGIECSPFTFVTAVANDGVHVVSEGRDAVLGGFDTVLLAGWHRPVHGLATQLKGRGPEIHRIGDALAARTVLQAVHEGERTARAL